MISSEKKCLTLAPFLTPGRVGLLETPDKKQSLNRMIDFFSGIPGIPDRREIGGAVFEREKIMSTGIGFGIGVPHCRLERVSGVFMAFGLCRTPVRDYPAIDDVPVRIIAMILAGTEQNEGYNQALSRLSAFLDNEARREALLKVQTREELISLLPLD
ncbi:MAG: PTS sugar transporter subunit IIA [Spirochaetales bacterium]|jgi:mannitol/fructose-specific phosphotransferase system IIA component (Ntr-type)|nr:PTS sugar transporter subunit IIA [Spirochaetales bacterium]